MRRIGQGRGRLLASFVGIGLVAAASGCVKSGPEKIQVQVPPPVQQLRSLLETYAKTGELDSGVVAIREQIDALRATDAAKADELAADLARFETLKAADAVKKQADLMLKKL